MLKIVGLLSLYVLLTACGGSSSTQDGAPKKPPNVSGVADAVPRDEPRSKYGNPKHYDVLGKRYYTLSSAAGYKERGDASWYGTKFHGRRTSSGEPYDMYAMTAAHKTLPLPTYVEVTNLDNGRKVIVKVNDRGPFHEGRIIDLSYSAAKKLDIIRTGTGRVEVRAISSSSNSGKASHIYLQVGAFSNKESAQQLKNKIQQQIGDAVVIMPIQSGNNYIYRVRIGPLASEQYSNSLANRLFDAGFDDAHIVIEK